MQTIINLKELRQNVSTYAERVSKGNSFIVMKRSKPIFRISPIDDDDGWETIIDFTKVRKGGVSAQEILDALRALK